ncbi:hypothetical protein CYMTET_44776, partial [Cymbomonas tetramitiformis]
VELQVLDAGSGDQVQTITSQLSSTGKVTFQDISKSLGKFDLFSLEDAAFKNLNIGMSFDLQLQPTVQASNLQVFFDPKDFSLEVDIKASSRTDAFLKQIPLKLEGFVVSTDNSTSLSDLGYFPLDFGADSGTLVDTLTYGFEFFMPISSLGHLLNKPKNTFGIHFCIGWCLDTSQVDSLHGLAVGIKFPDISGNKMRLGLYGVLDVYCDYFCLQNVKFSSGESGLMLAFLKAKLEILSLEIPEKGNCDVLLFAFPNKGIKETAWYLDYAKDPDQSVYQRILAGEPISKGQIGSQAVLQAVPAALAASRRALPGALSAARLPGPSGVSDDTSLIDFQYLGGGMKVGPPDGADLSTPAKAIQAMQDAFTSKDPDTLSGLYQPADEWMVAADFTLLDFVRVQLAFVDPKLYELELDVLKKFKIEAAYSRVNDKLGLYHTKLQVDDEARIIELGAVVLTLPNVEVWVWTNGDFKVDIGFPTTPDDWTACFQVVIDDPLSPFVGQGGLYFEKRSSATDLTLGPNVDLILGLGLAFAVGLGLEFNAGILEAQVKVTLNCTVEGKLGYPSGIRMPAPPKPGLFGTRVAEGLLDTAAPGVRAYFEGKVDFVIISASVYLEVYAGVAADLKVIDGHLYPSTVAVCAVVKAGAKVHFVFFTIHFSFHLKLSGRAVAVSCLGAHVAVSCLGAHVA